MHQNLSPIDIRLKKLCNKAVDTYPSAIQFVPECHKTLKTRDKAQDTCPFVFDSLPDEYQIQETCDKVISEEHFMLKHHLNR